MMIKMDIGIMLEYALIVEMGFVMKNLKTSVIVLRIAEKK